MDDPRPLTEILAEMGITHRQSEEVEGKRDLYVGEYRLGSYSAHEAFDYIEAVNERRQRGEFGCCPTHLLGIVIAETHKRAATLSSA